jgi:hypothetical protein
MSADVLRVSSGQGGTAGGLFDGVDETIYIMTNTAEIFVGAY